MKALLIHCTSRFVRTAIQESGRLTDYFVERQGAGIPTVGTVIKGRVANVLPGMQAAFVDIGQEKNAFLYIADLLPPSTEQTTYPPISSCVQEGEEIVVQIKKEGTGQKGARLTTHFSFPGRYVVYLPRGGYVAVSRKIEDEAERERLKKLGTSLLEPGEGLILRTVSIGATEEELQKDLRALRQIWQGIQKRAEEMPLYSILHQDEDLMQRIVRDWWTEDVTRIVIDREKEYQQLRRLFREQMPEFENRIVRYQGKVPLFDSYGVTSELEKLTRRRIWLKNGSYIVIEQTEALTSVDVNTGKYTGGKTLEETVLSTNLEAAEEIARQLRLRDVGGIVVIDFIDMKRPEHKEEVLHRFTEALKEDRSRVQLWGFSPLGLMELTRRKSRETAEDLLWRTCQTCQGRGREMSLEALADRLEVNLALETQQMREEAVLIEVHPSLAAVLIGPGGEGLYMLEESLGKRLLIKGNPKLPLGEYRLLNAGSWEVLRRQSLPVEVGEQLQVQIESTHLHAEADGIARIEGFIVQVEKAAPLVGQQVPIRITQLYRTYAKGVLLTS